MATRSDEEERTRERTYEEKWQQGFREGYPQGYRIGILPGIALGLEYRFGDAGLVLMEEIQALTSVEQLTAVLDRLLTAASLDEVRAVYRAYGVDEGTASRHISLTWIEIANSTNYVRATLTIEAPEILDLLAPTDTWKCVELPIELIQADTAMLAEHADNPVHQRRLEECLERIRLGRPLLPLILLHCERGARYLVDGYTRYRALQQLQVRSVVVLRQHPA